jgi:quinol monooxygenase YgiN
MHQPLGVRHRTSVACVIVVNRFRAAAGPAAADQLHRGLERALAALRARPGFVDGAVGRNVDDPALWLLTTWWENVGSYRRALSSYDVKLEAVPLPPQAIDEPSAYETVDPDGDALNQAVPRALE